MQTASSRFASSEALWDDELLGVIVLLDFLMGNSIDQVTRGHGLGSTMTAEALLRSVLLRHGYDVARGADP